MSGDRCKKMSCGIKGIEKTLSLHTVFFFFSVSALCLAELNQHLLQYY